MRKKLLKTTLSLTLFISSPRFILRKKLNPVLVCEFQKSIFSPHQPPVISTANATNGVELSAYYLLESNEGVNITKHSFIFDIQQNAEVQTLIRLPSDINLPDGALVKLRNELFCVVAGDTCIKPSFFLSTYGKGYDPACPRANGTYFFNCGERIISDCQKNVNEYEASTQISEACVNPDSKEQCTFSSLELQDFNSDYAAAEDKIACPTCSANYSWFNGNSGITISCKPKNCMPKCVRKPSHHTDESTATSFRNGVIYGLVSVVTVTVFLGLFIYVCRPRTGYQQI